MLSLRTRPTVPIVPRSRFPVPAPIVPRPRDWLLIGTPTPIINAPALMQIVIEQTATYFKVDASDILSAERGRKISLARHVAMYLCRMHLRKSQPEIGRKFKRDHTTVLSAVRKIERLIQSDEKLAVSISLLKRGIAK